MALSRCQSPCTFFKSPAAVAAAAAAEVPVDFLPLIFFVMAALGGVELSGSLFWLGGQLQGARERMNWAVRMGIFHPVARTSLFILQSGVIMALEFRIVRNGKDLTLHVASAEGNRRGLYRPLCTGNEEATIIAVRKNRDVWSN